MSPALRDLRLNARELLRQPGAHKAVTGSFDAGELGVPDPRVTGPVAVALVTTSTLDGVVVEGSVSVPWRSSCRRCLVDVDGVVDISIDEVYQEGAVDDADAFPIEGDQIDLVPAVREAVLLELPTDVLCRDECAGICPVCGIDRNQSSCECDTSVRDDRWAALDALRLDDD